MDIHSFFYVSNLSKIMSLLTVVIGTMIAHFARHYLRGDGQQTKFYVHLLTLQLSALLLIHSDNLLLFVLCWLCSNLILVRMISHKSVWPAARAGARIAWQYLLTGWACLFSACIIVYAHTGVVTFTQMANLSVSGDVYMFSALLFFLITAMIQSAVLPAHSWLLNTLNAPTPVSACMHAGLINAGVLLLVRLAPLFLQQPFFLYVMFIVGVVTATVGVIYKLIQPNVKRMLACSTIAQMGFVFVQCGLGFFTAAIAHIFWHGMFKAYLFLSSATIEEQQDCNKMRIQRFMIILSILCGILSAISFIIVQGFEDIFATTSLGMVLVAFVAGVQLGLTILQSGVYADIFVACFSAAILGLMYGFVDVMIHYPLHSLHAMQAQSLNPVYVFGLFLLLLPWIMMLGLDYLYTYRWFQRLYAYVYVYALGLTQARYEACTLYRNYYKYR